MQLQGHAGMHARPVSSGSLSHPSSGGLSRQSSCALPHHNSNPLGEHESAGQLHLQLPSQLPQAPSATLLSQYPSGQLSQHASGQLGHGASGQMSQGPSVHGAARHGSGPMASDLITHSLRGSQIALQLQAAQHVQQQQQAIAAAVADGTHTLAARTQPAVTNKDVLEGLPYRATGPVGQADTAYQQASAATAAGVYLREAHLQPGLQQHQWQQQQPPEQLHNERMPPQGSAVALLPDVHAQQRVVGMSPPSSHASAGVNSSNGMHGSDDHMASPDIGLKLGQVHSPGLSEDALGGDQEFIDAMQAMAGQICVLHPYCHMSGTCEFLPLSVYHLPYLVPIVVNMNTL